MLGTALPSRKLKAANIETQNIDLKKTTSALMQIPILMKIADMGNYRQLRSSYGLVTVLVEAITLQH